MIRFHVILNLALVLSLTSCANTTQSLPSAVKSPTPELHPTPTQILLEHGWQGPLDGSESIEHAIRDGFELWLGAYLGPETSPAHRLRDYRITQIASIDDLDLSATYDYVYLIEYSVLPRFEPSDWIAGDGRYGECGWIVSKIEHVGLALSQGSVYLTRLGPCPQC